MKTKLLALLLLFQSISILAEEIKNSMVIWTKDGTPIAYALAENPKVIFTETNLIITSKGVEVIYALDKMARFTYEYDEETFIKNLQTNEVTFKIKDESLLFPALKAHSTVSIYSISGTLVFKKTVQTAGEYSFPLSSLTAGTYLVTANGVTYKIVKK